jgi:hypothetical protein
MASVVPAIVLTACTVPILDERGWLAVGWLLPSLALCVAALALATWVSIESATIAVGVAWLAAPALARVRATEFLDAIAGPVQIAAVMVLAIGLTVVALRRTMFEFRVLP